MSACCRGFAYSLARLLRPLTTSTLRDMLAIVAHDDVATVWGILGSMKHTAEADLLRDSDGGSTSALAGWGSLQNASVSTRNSAHKTYGRQHDDEDDMREK